MYFITTKRMLEVCFSAHPNIQYRTFLYFRHTLGQLQRPLLTIPHIGCQSLIKLRFMTD